MIHFSRQNLFNSIFVKIAADNEKSEYELHKNAQIEAQMTNFCKYPNLAVYFGQ